MRVLEQSDLSDTFEGNSTVSKNESSFELQRLF